jgi:type IV pilus assembly protein PilC
MNYQYVACGADNRVIKGKLSAASQEAAGDMLAYTGYRVLSLKEVTPLFRTERLTAPFRRIDPNEIIMFTRQLALLLESGTDVVASLELLQLQVSNSDLRRIIGQVASDVRAGAPLSNAMSRHPKAFPPLYYRLVAVGEQTGSLEVVLRRVADYMERSAKTQASITGALVYPAIITVLAVIVIAVMVAFVFPAFSGLYSSFGVELPAVTRIFMAIAAWLQHYGLWLLLGIVAIGVGGYFYTRTPAGRYQWDKLALSFPRIGHINLLNELSRCCRSMALLYASGLALPEIMTLVIQGSNNKAMSMALTEVREDMIAGEGLSHPMTKNELFMPLMVQMTQVGEETGNLDNTLNTVAESYEYEADVKTKAMVELITPLMTVIMGLIIGFIALALLSAMYSIYSQVGF